MPQSKREFFHKGINGQKRPDIVIDLKRPDAEEMIGWTKAEKREARKFLDEAQRTFQEFMNATIERLA